MDSSNEQNGSVALVKGVSSGSPAYRAGMRAGQSVTSVNGRPLLDMIDWMWESAADSIFIEAKDDSGSSHVYELARGDWEDWGLEFEGIVFDGVRTCKNSCIFCFMRQLPDDSRDSLMLRDDDWRLSFLQGTFVTLTNLDDADIERITSMGVSPLRVSLHAADPDIRRQMVGKHADDGMRNLVRLMEAGIEFDAQIVLIPSMNDGKALEETLMWAYEWPQIRNVGIVPLGFTRFQDRFEKSYDSPADALGVIEALAPIQERALKEKGHPWAYASDELYRNAYGDEILQKLPDASFYGDFELFEDGIGILRESIDSFLQAAEDGKLDALASNASGLGIEYAHVCGEAMLPHYPQLLKRSALDGVVRALPVKNSHFGGNVNVTGLLSGKDVVQAICQDAEERQGSASRKTIYLVPEAIFNANGMTLDGLDESQLKEASDADIMVVPSNPLDCFEDIVQKLQGERWVS